MCVVSFIGEHYEEKWNNPPYPDYWNKFNVGEISREEFENLKKEVEEMKKLLKKAKKYDQDHNEPDCEIDAKITKLKQIAKLVGVDLDDVLLKEVFKKQ